MKNMGHIYILYVFVIFIILCVMTEATEIIDQPCIPRNTEDSIVCVCNSTYCDTVTREYLEPGNYITYTSSRAGLRFSKNRGIIEQDLGDYIACDKVLQLQPDVKYQTIEGFGGAVTDSAGINWKSLSIAAQQHLINSYCSEHGIEYNMIRTPCGSSDFSTRFWAYNEFPVNDTKFTNFTLSPEDIFYKVPMIQACMNVATADVKVVTATWSPSKWMLTKDWPSEFNSISENNQQAYADYHCKFAELYKEQGINIWGMSMSNEPLSSILFDAPKQEFMVWTISKMVKYLEEYFGPTIRNCSVEGIKILAVDDQRNTLPIWILMIDGSSENITDNFDGIALHYYTDKYSSPGDEVRSMNKFSDKFIINTEACTGSGAKDKPKVDLGSWKRAQDYIADILENLNYYSIGWLDWNMCLNKEGGPTWLNNFVDSPIIVDAEKDEFYKQPMYYGFGHFSKFIPRGSQRIDVMTASTFNFIEPQLKFIEETGQKYYDHVAFWTPRGTYVVVIHNEGPCQTIIIKINYLRIAVELEEESITTVEFAL